MGNISVSMSHRETQCYFSIRQAELEFQREEGIMKDTGMVRKVDNLGRIVVPIEIRRALGIAVRDPLSISVEGDRIVLSKYAESCILCGSEKLQGAKEIHGKHVCEKCQLSLGKS